MLDSNFNLKLIDFGTAYFFNQEFIDKDTYARLLKIKKEEEEEEETENPNYDPLKQSFVGTSEYLLIIRYVSPELLKGEGISYAVDIWAFG